MWRTSGRTAGERGSTSKVGDRRNREPYDTIRVWHAGWQRAACWRQAQHESSSALCLSCALQPTRRHAVRRQRGAYTVLGIVLDTTPSRCQAGLTPMETENSFPSKPARQGLPAAFLEAFQKGNVGAFRSQKEPKGAKRSPPARQASDFSHGGQAPAGNSPETCCAGSPPQRTNGRPDNSVAGSLSAGAFAMCKGLRGDLLHRVPASVRPLASSSARPRANVADDPHSLPIVRLPSATIHMPAPTAPCCFRGRPPLVSFIPGRPLWLASPAQPSPATESDQSPADATQMAKREGLTRRPAGASCNRDFRRRHHPLPFSPQASLAIASRAVCPVSLARLPQERSQ